VFLKTNPARNRCRFLFAGYQSWAEKQPRRAVAIQYDFERAGQKWKELSDLLPNVTAQVSEHVAQDNLAARGLRFPGFPTVVGPYGFFDARVYLKQSVLDFSVLERVRAAAANEQAAQYSYKDARDLVVLVTGMRICKHWQARREWKLQAHK